MRNLAIRTKLVFASLLINCIAGLFFLINLYFINISAPNLFMTLAGAAASMLVLFIITMFILSRAAKPIDIIYNKLKQKNVLSLEDKSVVKKTHFKVFIFAIVVTNTAAIIGFIGTYVTTINTDFFSLEQIIGLLNTLSTFVLASIVQVAIFNMIIGNVRSEMNIESLDSTDKKFGILPKLIFISIGLVIVVGGNMAMWSQSGYYDALSDFGYDPRVNPDIISEIEASDINKIINSINTMRENLNITNSQLEEVEKIIKAKSSGDLSEQDLKLIFSTFANNKLKLILTSSYINNQISSIVIIFICLIIAIAVAILFAHDFKLQIKRIKNKIKNLLDKKEKDLTGRLSITSIDEMSELTHYVNGILNNQENEIHKIKEVSDNILNTSIQLDDIVNIVNKSIEDIKTKSIETKGASQNQLNIISYTQENINDIVESIKHVNNQIIDQNAITEESSSAIHEMMASISSVDNMTVEASSITTQLLDIAKAGSQYIYENDKAIKDIKEASDTVSEIITVISEIAKKTGLLSMNASIEAAHAGQAGKGFSVVAHSIRSLAVNSTESAKQIIEQVSYMTEQIEEGVEQSKQVSIAFREILKKIEETNNLIKSISSAMKEQHIGAKEVIVATNSMLESSSNIKELSDEQKKKSIEMESNSKLLVSSSRNIHKSSELQEIVLASILESIIKLKEISGNNKNVVNSLKKLTDLYKFDKEETTNLVGITNVNE